MNIFAFNIIMLAFWGIVFRKSLDRETARRPGFIVVATLQLALIALFSPLVSDAVNYAYHASIDWYPFEPGWNLCSRILWDFWPDGKSLMLFANFAFLLSFARFVWKRSENFFVSYLVMICLGIWGMTFFILRQTVALAIILFAYDALEERSPLAFVALVILAATFHTTALAFLLVYPFIYVRRDAIYLLAFLFIGFICILFGPELIRMILIFSRNDYEVTELSGVNLLLMLLAFEVMIDLYSGKTANRTQVRAFDIGLVFQSLALRLSNFTRATKYFTISLSTLIPNMLRAVEDERRRMLIALVSCGALLIFYFVFDDCSFPGGPDAYIVTSPF